MTNSVVFASNGSCSTVKLTSASAHTLRECESVTFYQECGYYCAIGWTGDNQTIRVHANSQRELDIALGRVKLSDNERLMGY